MEVLSVKTETNQEVILKSNTVIKLENAFVHAEIGKYLKNHQIDGIKFLFDNCYDQNSGCILAHCMGLGKTLQVIALLHAVINSKEYQTNKILVLCPVSTISNWKEEVVRWLGPIDDDGLRKLQIFELEKEPDIHRKIACLQNWSKGDSESPAVCLLMGYESFRNLVNFHVTKANVRKFSASCLSQIQQRIRKFLLESPDIVICDEGHVIKNSTAATTMAVNQIETKRRIVLTGTPMQNHLMEYFSMVNFVKPNFLGTKQHFNEYFAEPIKNGQHADSVQSDIKYMKQRSYALNKKLSKIVQRREISLLKDFLPEKFEFVLFVPLTQIQSDLYEYFLRNRGGAIEYKRLFGDYTCLRKIWTHLKVLDNAHQKCVAKKKRATNRDDEDDSGEDDEEEYAASGALQLVDNDWWRKVIDKRQLEIASSSYKMILLFEILKECQRVGDKCVIFSGFVEVLNVVEFFMQQIDQRQRNGYAAPGLENFHGTWKKNEDYYRFDGNTPKERRHTMIRKFNDVSNKRTKVFLITSTAGGQGINLFGANRLILLDTSWNPAKDQQSIYRIYRMGQTKHCYIYRLLSMGTMEEKIYSRSVTKQAMSRRVVDKQQIDRHYSMNELYELYSLTKTNMNARPVPIPPKDHILAHLLQEHPNMVYKYLEHDSLLENKSEEELNEIEKNEAWLRCQEQNSQMQALSMMPNAQPTVTTSCLSLQDAPARVPFKSRNEVAPGSELKERSVLKTSKATDYCTHNKENLSLAGERVGLIPEGTIVNNADGEVKIECPELAIAKEISESFDASKGPSNEMELENCDDKGKLFLPVEQFANGKSENHELKIESSGLESPKDISKSIDSLNGPLASNEMDLECSEYKINYDGTTITDKLLLLVEQPENGNDENREVKIESSILEIPKDILEEIDPSKEPLASNEMEIEFSEYKITPYNEASITDELFLPVEQVESHDENREVKMESSGLAIPKDISEEIDPSKEPSASNEMELENSEDKGTSYNESSITKELPLPVEQFSNGNCENREVETESSWLATPKDISEEIDPSKPLASFEMELENSEDKGTSYNETSITKELLLPVEQFSNGNCENREVKISSSVLEIPTDISESIDPSNANGPLASNKMALESSEDKETPYNETSINKELLLPVEQIESEKDENREEKIESSGIEIPKDISEAIDPLNGPLASNEMERESSEDKEASYNETSITDDIPLPVEQFANGNDENREVKIESSVLEIQKYTSQSTDPLNGPFATNETELEGSEDKGTSYNETSITDELLLPVEQFANGNDESSVLEIPKDISGSIDPSNGLSAGNEKECSEVKGSTVLSSPEHPEAKTEAPVIESSFGILQELSLPLENIGNCSKDICEGATIKSISDFVKGLLDTLNNTYAAPDAMEEYATKVEIISPNQFNNLEYRIALKRPANSTIHRPIKRLKLSLEIDPTATICVDNPMSTVPITTECQPSLFREHSQSMDANFAHLNGSWNQDSDSLNGAKTGNSSDVEELFSNGPGQSMENLNDALTGNTSNGEELFSNGREQSVDRLNDAMIANSSDEDFRSAGDVEMSPDKVTQRTDERLDEDEDMSSNQHSEESECEQDSLGDMSESEMSSADTQELYEPPRYDEQPSMISKIKKGCVIM